MKKIRVSLIAISIVLISMFLTNMVYAANTMDLNIKENRPYTGSKFTITVGGNGIQKDAIVFKVLRKDGGAFVTDDKFALYCLRSGLGFGHIDSITLDQLSELDDVRYEELGDLNQDVDTIIDYYKNTIGYIGIDTYNSYNAILWIADNMYLPENPDMDKDKFLKRAGLEGSTLNADEIEVIQQAALWYFSNYDHNGEPFSLSLRYNPGDTENSAALGSLLKNDGRNYDSNFEKEKFNQINELYKYFIEGARTNAAKYGNGNVRSVTTGVKRAEFDRTNQMTISKNADGYFIIGPVNIKKTNAIDDFEIEVKIKDAQGNVIPEKAEGNLNILYQPDDEHPGSYKALTVEELIGNGDKYIVIPDFWKDYIDLSKITIEMRTTYFETKSSLWIAAADEQPILKVEKEKKEDTDIITTDKITGPIILKINKTDKDGQALIGASFIVTDETPTRGRGGLAVNDNKDGTFEVAALEIDTEGQIFILDIKEDIAPVGYTGIKGSFKIKITTKLSADKTKYIIDKVELVDAAGNQTTVPGIRISFVDDTGIITVTVENDKGKEFDLALRKYITKINGKELTGQDDRTPKVDTSKLNTDKITTAKYTHSKTPVVVKKGDIITYKIRVYNEGELDGYATKVADYVPEGLGYLMNYKSNTDNLWYPVPDGNNQTMKLVGADGLYKTDADVKNLKSSDFFGITDLSDVQILKGKAKIYSTALAEKKIKAYNPETKIGDIEATDTWQQSTIGTSGLYYREVEVTCIVLAENSYEGILRNIAEVQEHRAVDETGNTVNVRDRDSDPDNADINNYNPPADNSSYQQDDDDYEPIILKHFDLALRKFITGVNENAVTTRIPQPKIGDDGKLKYEHDKTPVYVANSDYVTYTIRVYNEGTVLGYATEVADDIPDGLVFVPTNETNIEYGWKMYDVTGQETNNVSEAKEIRTRFLENTRLNPYDSSKAISTTDPLNPDYADVKVVFQVVEKNITAEDRIIINKAQITEDKAVDEDGNEIDIDDDDSIPDEWNEGEDDQDIEKIYVKVFDLALLKWVTQTIVTVDGQTVTTDTGFTPYDDPEPIAKVVIDKKKIDKTTVKFVYNIMIENQGEIAGYATEITDYIPAGLAFDQADNPQWVLEADNKITTRALEGTLLEPGETAIVPVIFTWINGSDNLGTKTNIAEISEDYNDYGSPDKDSIPDNVQPEGYDKQQEDDDDKALVHLELKLGGEISYVWLVLVVLTIITGGVILIKKYVLA